VAPGKIVVQVRRLFKTRQVILNGNLCEEPGYRLRLVDVVKLLPHSLARRRGRRTSASAISTSILRWWKNREGDVHPSRR